MAASIFEIPFDKFITDERIVYRDGSAEWSGFPKQYLISIVYGDEEVIRENCPIHGDEPMTQEDEFSLWVAEFTMGLLAQFICMQETIEIEKEQLQCQV